MFFNYRHLDELGYEGKGFFVNLTSCDWYKKHIPETNSFIVFASIDNSITIYFLKEDDYNKYKSGEYSVTTNKWSIENNSKSIHGYPQVYGFSICFLKPYNTTLTNRKKLKKALSEAEEFAKVNTIDNFIEVRGKVIAV